LLSSNFDAHQVVAFDTVSSSNSNVSVLYVVMEGSSTQIGLVTNSAYSSSKYIYTLDLEANTAAQSAATGGTPQLMEYHMYDGKVKQDGTVFKEDWTLYFESNGDLKTSIIGGTDAVTAADDDYVIGAGKVTASSSSSVTINGEEYGKKDNNITTNTNPGSYTITSSTIIYNMTDDEKVTRTSSLKDEYVIIVADKNEAKYILVYEIGTTSDNTVVAGSAKEFATLLENSAAIGTASVLYDETDKTVTVGVTGSTATVTLASSIKVPDGVTLIIGNGVTLDLSGKTVTLGSKSGFNLANGATLKDSVSGGSIAVAATATVTIDANVEYAGAGAGATVTTTSAGVVTVTAK